MSSYGQRTIPSDERSKTRVYECLGSSEDHVYRTETKKTPYASDDRVNLAKPRKPTAGTKTREIATKEKGRRPSDHDFALSLSKEIETEAIPRGSEAIAKRKRQERSQGQGGNVPREYNAKPKTR
jgi:hypothetical protein